MKAVQDMQNTLTYKGFTGSVEFSEEDNLLCGEVQGIGALIIYDGKDMADLEKRFHESVNAHLESCADQGTDPYNTSHFKKYIAKPLKTA